MNPWMKYQVAKMKYLGQAAGDVDYSDGNQRYFMEDFLTNFTCDQCRMPEQAEICMRGIDQLKKVDFWIMQVAMGVFHIAKGWQYRGAGYAKSVSREGWRKFEQELDSARRYLTQAYNLHPIYPETSANMIQIAMAAQDRSGQKQWFMRSVNAQFDYLPAYRNLLWALRSRWGGSHGEMLKLGIECLNTKRFDTRVPSQFMVALFRIGEDLDNWRAPCQWLGIYDLIQQYFDGLLNEPKNKDFSDENRSFYAVVAWAAGQYEDARRIRLELGDKFDAKAYSHLNVTEHQALNDLEPRRQGLPVTWRAALGFS